MRYAICNEMYGDLPLREAFAHAASLGYSGIEIAPFTLGESVFEIDDATRKQLRQAADDNGLEVIGLHWLLAKTEGLHLTSDDTTTQQKTARYLGELARLCHELGGQIMVFGSPQQRNVVEGMSMERASANALRVIEQVVPLLEKFQVTLAMEPLGPEEGNFLLTAESAVELIRKIGSNFVQLHLDVKAMSTESKPIEQIIRDNAEWLVHFHANDPNRLGPGMGDVNYEPIFAALKEIEYAGWFSVEAFDYSPGIEVLARKSIEYMKHIQATLV